MVLWGVLPVAERDKVLRGTSVTYRLPSAAAKPVYQMLLTLTEKDDQPLVGPPLVTYDLDEKSENMLPQLRARVTARRKNSIIGAFGVLDLTTLVPLPPSPPGSAAKPDDARLPVTAGENGRFVGVRDELVTKVAEGCGTPILSRHRALPDSTYGLRAANRTIGEVADDLGKVCEATGTVSRGGFRLFRSRSELIDDLYLPPAPVVARYLQSRPGKDKRIGFETVAPLAALPPIQLKVLQRSNTRSEDAEFAYDCYGLLRFYNALTPQQRVQLFSGGKTVGESGLDVTGLSHTALHAFLDERTKRGDLNIYGELQEITGLRLLFTQKQEERENTFMSQGLRGNEVKTTATRELPQVDQEEQPTAK